MTTRRDLLTTALTAAGVSASRSHAPAVARFRVGQHVRARELNPIGHTRLPRYARGRPGVITRDHGVYVFNDSLVQGSGPAPQHLYSVRFMARDLLGGAGERPRLRPPRSLGRSP